MSRESEDGAFEAACAAVLSALAGFARSRGISPRRFRAIVGRALDGRLTHLEPSLPYAAAVRLVSRWSSDPAYAERGRPRPLPFDGRRSFRGLVRAAKAGSPASVLAALESAGIARRDRRGAIRLLSAAAGAYVPPARDDLRLDIAGRAVADLLRVVTHNLSAPAAERFLQRTASYDNIGASSLMMLRRALRREGMRALERANALLASRDRDRNARAPGGRRSRVSFGIYVLEEPTGAARRRGKGGAG